MNLCVNECTIRRDIHRFETSGEVSKKEYPSEATFRKITEPVQFYIIHLVLEKTYLSKITKELKMTLGVDVTESAVCKFLKKVGFIRQKLCIHASQRDEEIREKFVRDVSLYPRETLLFIDETGSDRRDTLRKRGYSLRGQPAVKQNLVVRGQHVSAIAAMSVEGIVALELVRGGVNSDTFYRFVCKSRLSKLMPFNGSNPNSVISLDNCSIHHVGEVKQILH